MSDGDRGEHNRELNDKLGLLVAIILACLIVGFLAYVEGYQGEARQNRTYEYEQAAKRNAIVACADPEPAAVADCVYDEIDSAHEKSESGQDLDAQQWMARWAAVLTIITAMTTLISWIALRYLRVTFQQTAKGAEAAAMATGAMIRQNEIAEAAQRPWIEISCNVKWLEKSESRIEFAFEISFKNSGKMVAGSLCATGSAFVAHVDSTGRVNEFWGEAREQRQDCNAALLPGEILPRPAESMSRTDFPSSQWGIGETNHYAVIVATAAHYRAPGSAIWSVTERAFIIGIRRESDFDGYWFTPTVENRFYEADELRVVHSRYGETS